MLNRINVVKQAHIFTFVQRRSDGWLSCFHQMKWNKNIDMALCLLVGRIDNPSLELEK